MRDMLNDLLLDTGCALFFAEDGQEGLCKAQETKPDLILLDIMLPSMDGFEVCRRIRLEPEISSIPVLMMTGNNTEDSARRGLEVGAMDVLAKPFNMPEFKLRVQTTLQLNRYRLLAGERRQFQWVVDHSQAGYVILDMKDQVTYTNEAAKMLLHIEEEEPEKQSVHFFDLIEDTYQYVPEGEWDNWPKLQDEAYIVRPESATSNALWLKVDIVPGAEETAQRIIRFRDVTQEILMFENIWQFEQMVSHKLRTPLNSIIGSLDTLELDAAQWTEEARSQVQEASQAAEQLNDNIRAVLDHLLSYSQGKGERAEETTTTGKLENFTNQLAVTCGIDHFTISIEPALHLTELEIGKEDLLLILQELFDNCVKFHPERKPSIEMELQSKDETRAVLSVRDDGVPVDSALLQKIGRPFYQAEKHFTGESPGMGLGLSMIATKLGVRGGVMRVRNRQDTQGFEVHLDIRIRK